MAEVEYMHICDYAFRAEGGKACIIGIFDVIGAPSFPVTHPHMVIAIQLRGSAHETVPIKIELGRPNGDVVAGLDGQVGVGGDGGAFINFNLLTTTFPEPGRYTVKVSSGDRHLATQSIHVRKAQASAGPAAQVH
jgi:hypothetical protein